MIYIFICICILIGLYILIFEKDKKYGIITLVFGIIALAVNATRTSGTKENECIDTKYDNDSTEVIYLDDFIKSGDDTIYMITAKDTIKIYK